MNIVKNTFAAAQSLAVILICLYIAVHLPALHLGFYAQQFRANNVHANINISEAELMRVTTHMLRYMRGAQDDLQIHAVVDGETRPFFSEREILHMVDVYDLFAVGRMIRNIALITLAAALLAAYMGRGHRFLAAYARANQIGIGISAAVLAVLAAVIALDFDTAFIVFHEIFFFNDLWILDPAVDLLINMVPTPFFVHIAIIVGLLFAGLLAAVFGASVLYRVYGVKT